MTPTRRIDKVESAIYLIRGQRVMLDSDLAAIYQVPTKQLNQQLRRNRKRFPVGFAFQFTREELTDLRSQIVTSNKGRGGRLEPEQKAKREIGFHARERSTRYRTKKRF